MVKRRTKPGHAGTTSGEVEHIDLPDEDEQVMERTGRPAWTSRIFRGRDENYDEVDRLVTAVAVGGAAAIIESKLLPGILIGAGAMLVGRMFPQIGGVVRPVIKGVVRAGYAVTDTARGAISEAGEQLRDVVAEVRTERRGRTGTREGGGGSERATLAEGRERSTEAVGSTGATGEGPHPAPAT